MSYVEISKNLQGHIKLQVNRGLVCALLAKYGEKPCLKSWLIPWLT